MNAGERTSGRVLMSIGVVAARAGVHPQTLREYERQGLVTPQRTPGGTRRYGEAEVQRLLRIQRLTQEGMSLNGVRYVLDLEDRLRRAEQQLRELEARGANPARSVSLELVHVPRAPRSTRWRNDHH
jgi:MerR family transcriptional regulator/heat shock protein HspR